jgi:hypothetical protein
LGLEIFVYAVSRYGRPKENPGFPTLTVQRGRHEVVCRSKWFGRIQIGAPATREKKSTGMTIPALANTVGIGPCQKNAGHIVVVAPTVDRQSTTKVLRYLDYPSAGGFIHKA